MIVAQGFAGFGSFSHLTFPVVVLGCSCKVEKGQPGGQLQRSTEYSPAIRPYLSDRGLSIQGGYNVLQGTAIVAGLLTRQTPESYDGPEHGVRLCPDSR